MPAYAPTFSYNLQSTDPLVLQISRLRLRLGDTDLSQTAQQPWSALFSDQELSVFVSANGGDDILAYCDALLAAASSSARLAAFVNLQGGGEVNLSEISDKLLATEKEVRDRYINTPAFAIIEMNWDDFTARQIITNSILRSIGP